MNKNSKHVSCFIARIERLTMKIKKWPIHQLVSIIVFAQSMEKGKKWNRTFPSFSLFSEFRAAAALYMITIIIYDISSTSCMHLLIGGPDCLQRFIFCLKRWNLFVITINQVCALKIFFGISIHLSTVSLVVDWGATSVYNNNQRRVLPWATIWSRYVEVLVNRINLL